LLPFKSHNLKFQISNFKSRRRVCQPKLSQTVSRPRRLALPVLVVSPALLLLRLALPESSALLLLRLVQLMSSLALLVSLELAEAFLHLDSAPRTADLTYHRPYVVSAQRW